MIKQEVYDIAQYAAKLYKLLKHYEDMPGEVDFPHWWQSKIVKAKAMLSKAQHYLDFETKEPHIDSKLELNEIDADKPELYSTKDLLQAVKELSAIRADAASKGQEVLVAIANKDIERIHKVLKRRKDSQDSLDSMQKESKNIADVKKGDTIVHDTKSKKYKVQSIISKDKLKVVDKEGNVKVVSPYYYHIEEPMSEGAEDIMDAYNDVLDLVKKHSRRLSDNDSYVFGLKLKSWFEKNILDETADEEENSQDWVDQAIKDYEEMQANKHTRNDDALETGNE